MKKRILIRGGRILTMAGRVLPEGCVLLENGKITDVAERIRPEDTPEGYHNLEILDASGCLVMPGLIDAHCHIGITEEKKGAEGDDCNENVLPITPWLRAIDAVNMMDAAFDDAVRAGITSVMTGPGSSNVAGGQFAFLKTKGRRIDDLIVKAPAAMKIAFGENPKANFSGKDQSPVTRMAIAGLLREELFKAVQYRRDKQAFQNQAFQNQAFQNQALQGQTFQGRTFQNQPAGSDGFRPDFRMECWLPVLEGEIPLKAHVHRADDIFTAIRIAREFGLSLTLDHCSEGHLIAEEIAAEGFPAIVGPDLASRNKSEVQNMAFKTASVLHRAGVLVAVTTDHPVSLIQYLPLCAGLAVRSGLPPEEGLRAITCNPAAVCRVDDRVGSLEPGKDADVAIFTGNPMETGTRTMCTIIDGEIAYRAGGF